MPYVPEEDRKRLLKTNDPKTVGELNFLITMTCSKFLQNTTIKRTYQDYNNVIGVLEACKLEMYHKIVRPYEETKMKENGDVIV